MNNKTIIGREIFFPNIIFLFVENWELQNWYDTCTKEATYGLSSGNKWGLGNIPPDVPKIIAKAKSTEDALNKAKIILVEFLKTSEASHQIQETSERAQKRWNKIASEYFLKISKKSITHFLHLAADVLFQKVNLCLINLMIFLIMPRMKLCILNF